MPHGTPDWGLVGPKRTVYGLDDLGEHAVRLGSVALWDRRGDVIWATDFSEGLNGVGREVLMGVALPTLFCGDARQGAFCVQATVGPAAGEWAGILKRFPFPMVSGMGWEISHNLHAHILYARMRIILRTVVATYEAGIQYDVPANELQYYDAGGLWPPFATGLNLYSGGELQHTTKMVIDSTTMRYVRVIADDVEYSLAGIPINSAGGGGTRHARVSARVYNRDDLLVYYHVDSAIVTHNEP